MKMNMIWSPSLKPGFTAGFVIFLCLHLVIMQYLERIGTHAEVEA
jgi:hypothetical protein